jgi:hypothetical protein
MVGLKLLALLALCIALTPLTFVAMALAPLLIRGTEVLP